MAFITYYSLQIVNLRKANNFLIYNILILVQVDDLWISFF